MDRPDWSLGAVGLSLVAIAAVALLVGGVLLATDELRTPRIQAQLERVSSACERRADRVSPATRDLFVDDCEAREKHRLNPDLFTPN